LQSHPHERPSGSIRKTFPPITTAAKPYRAKGDLDPAIADYNEAIRHSPVSCDLDCAWNFFMMNMVVGRTCGAREAGVVRVDLMLSVPQMFRRQPLDQLV
jgi:hypothetical protein